MAESIPVSSPEQETVNPFELFARTTQPTVEALSLIGYEEGEVKFCGHVFTLRTLRPAEKAAIAIVIKPWRDTMAEPEVWQNAHVALALTSVDGDQEFCEPATPDLAAHARARLSYLTNPQTGWLPPTCGVLYAEYLKLEQKAIQAVEELQNLSEGNLAPWQASPGSSKEQDSSADEIGSDTRPSIISS